NQGACHGNQNGKNGFKLSLRGDDPAFDFASLTRDMLGRRTDPLRPAESLILLKATASVPHEGGRRFGVDSPEYAILSRWIATGLWPDADDAPRLTRLDVSPMEKYLVEPEDRIQLHVHGTFSDGTIRDLARFAVYEPSNPVATVTPTGEVQRQ